ncbi:leucine-rich repeat-containing protein 15-like [Photinus pyralis]|nr:leucine-rich repeat-containing protein 15-like [Photinus pyralis]
MIKTYVLVLLLKTSLQCTVPTFEKNRIYVNGHHGVDTQIISGCISPDTIRFKGITEITVDKQNIPDLNYGAVQGISTKFRISFVNTSIEIIREGAFLNLPKLERIYFRDNDLFWIGENAFQDLPSLTAVIMNFNKITELSPRAFSNLPHLTEVSFHKNNLENFDQSWFYKTPLLRFLTVSHNRLRKITRGAFITLPAIEKIYFGNNEIEFVDKDAFKGLRHLESLNLGQNKLKKFDFNFYTPSKLRDVYFQYNNITYISDEMLDVLGPTLLSLYISGNPLQCACLDKIIQWSDALEISVPQLKSPQSGAGAVCTLPKTKPSQCLERRDYDFQEGFSVGFTPLKPIPSYIFTDHHH